MHLLALIVLVALWRLLDHAPTLVQMSPQLAIFLGLFLNASVVVLALGGCAWFVAQRATWRSIVRFRAFHVAWFAAVGAMLLVLPRETPSTPVVDLLVLGPLLLAWVASWVVLAPAFQSADGFSSSIGSAGARIRRRIFAWVQGPAFIYLAPVVVGVLVVELLESSQSTNSNLLLLGGASIAIVAIWVGAAGYQLRRILRPLNKDEASIQRQIEAASASVGAKFHSVLVWNTAGAIMNAAVAGVGRFQSLLLTDVLLRELSPEEVGHIARHEAAHVRRKHWLFRMAAITLPVSFWISFYQLTQWEDAFFWSIIAPAFTLVWMAVAWSWFCRRLEFDADIHACLNSKGECDALHANGLAATLLTIAAKSNADPDQAGWMHPSVAQRAKRLTSTADLQSGARFTTAICRALLVGNIACWVVALAGCMWL